MKLYYLIIFVIFSGVIGCSDKNSNPEPKKEEKKNFTGCRLIKALTSTGGGYELIYDGNNNITQENILGSAGNVTEYTTYHYDSVGNITSSEAFYNNNPSNPTLITTRQYQYNSLNRVTIESTFSPAYTYPIKEIRYSYSGNGKTDSSWTYVYNNGSLNPQWLLTYGYDVTGNLLKIDYYSVQTNNGTQVFTYSGSDNYSNYDNFKNPLNQESFTLRNLAPHKLFTKNNPGFFQTVSSGNKFTYSYQYRADSLVAEVNNLTLNNSTQYIYDCN